MRRDSFKTTEQHEEFAHAIARGVGIKHALILAGYSPAQARKGWAIVNRSRGLRLALQEKAKLLRDLGRSISAQDQENLVRGRLVLNVIQGSEATCIVWASRIWSFNGFCVMRT